MDEKVEAEVLASASTFMHSGGSSKRDSKVLLDSTGRGPHHGLQIDFNLEL